MTWTLFSVGVTLMVSLWSGAYAQSTPDPLQVQPTRSAAYRKPDGSWQAARNLEIGIFASRAPYRWLMGGLNRFDLYVDTGQFGESIPADCKGHFTLPWTQLRQQRVAGGSVPPFPFNTRFDQADTRRRSAATLTSGKCTLTVLMTPRERFFDSAFPGWRQFEGVPENTIERFGAKEKLAMWGSLVHLDFKTRRGEHVEHGFFVPNDLPAVEATAAPQWFAMYVLIFSFFTFLIGRTIVAPMLLWFGGWLSPRSLRVAGLGLRLWWTATTSLLGPAWMAEWVNSRRHVPTVNTRLMPVSEVRHPEGLVVVVTGTWNDEAAQERLLRFTQRVTTGLAADVKMFEWPGRNSEADRIEAGVALANDLRDLNPASYERIVLVGFSHGGNVARVALSELGASASHARLLLLGVPHASIRPRAVTDVVQNAAAKGVAMLGAVVMAFIVCGASIGAVALGWISLGLVGLTALAVTMILGTGFYIWAGRHSRVISKFRSALAVRSILRHSARERQVAFAKDNVLQVYARLGRVLLMRHEVEALLRRSRGDDARRPEARRAWKAAYLFSSLVLACVSFLGSLYFPSTSEWYQGFLVATGACVFLAAFPSQMLGLLIWRPQRFLGGPVTPLLGASFFHAGMAQAAKVVGMSRFGYAQYEIEIEESPIDLVLPDREATGMPFLRNWHRQIVTAPRVGQRIANLLREEFRKPPVH